MMTALFFVASKLIKYGNPLTIVLRGTKNIPFSHDFLHDIYAESTDYFGVQVHAGFYTFLSDVQATLADYAEQHPAIQTGNLNILATGHSLSAAGTNPVDTWLNNPRNNWAMQSDVLSALLPRPRLSAEIIQT
jgi:hypothetical protein